MMPRPPAPKQKNVNRTSTIISIVVHTILILGLVYLAAKNGYLGKKIEHAIEVTQEKKKEPEKPKDQPKPKDVPKVDQTPKNTPPKYVEQPKQETAAVNNAPPAAAPPAADVPAFQFEGGAAVNEETNPVVLYKNYIEYSLRAVWARPENMEDDNWVAEVKVDVDKQGGLANPTWLKGSGNAKWDDSVKAVFKAVTAIDRRPPTNFPSNVTIRFDVAEQTEPVAP